MSLIKTQPKLLVGNANPAGERHCNKLLVRRQLSYVSTHTSCLPVAAGRV